MADLRMAGIGTAAAAASPSASGVQAGEGGRPAIASAIECAGLGKAFEGVTVLRDISAHFAPGSVNVLAGENGAGKSTLFKIISGQIEPDAGELWLHGERVRRFDARHARRLRVSIIPQELAPFPDMPLWQNLAVGRELCGPLGFTRRRLMIAQARAMLEGVGLDIDPRLPMKKLGIAATQMVEILKATSVDARVVLMDEPSSSLSTRESEHLFRVIGMLRERGACILYTSHRMEEIERIADTVAVMRDGAIVRHEPVGALSEREIVSAMVGREIGQLFPSRSVPPSATVAETVLAVGELRVKGSPASVSFELKRGEILGFGGLVGAGRSEMLEAIFGLRPARGEVRLEGRRMALGKVAASIRAGLAMVPEDRKLAGVLTSMSVLDNVTLPRLARFIGADRLLRNERRRRDALAVLERTRVKYARTGQKLAHLSGGNQQKVALARWLIGDLPKVLILDEPTRGIDVAARGELYRLIDQLAEQGVSILLASSDMPELINLSHRVMVMRGGAIAGELSRDQLDQETILRLAMGRQDDAKP